MTYFVFIYVSYKWRKMYDILPDILTQATEALAPTGVTGRTQWTWKALPEEVRLGGVVGSLRGKKAWKAIRNTMENMASVARYFHSWPHLGLGRQSTFEVGLLFSYQGGPAWRHTAGWIDQHTVDDQCMTWALAAGVIHGFFVDIDRMRVFSAALSIQRCVIMHSEQCWWNITYIIHA